MDTFLHEAFIQLVRLGIGKSKDAKIPEKGISWPEIRTLAERHGLYAVVLDGIEKLLAPARPPQEFLLEWIGEVLQGYEYQYEQYCKVIAKLAEFYNSHGYKMMVLKGYACSLDWPKPNHRPCGDIDIWLFGKQKEADAVLAKEKGIKVDKSHHHHTVFNWGDFMVENHYDFINVHHRKSNAKLEKILKELGQNDTYTVDVNDEKVYLPSPNLHALFLIRHMVSHFASSEISLRQVLDWAFFVEKHEKEIDWDWLWNVVEKYHMKDFVNCINAICVEELGFAASIFHGVQFIPELKYRVLEDIMSPAFGAEEPKYLIPRLIYKFHRWKGNAWKQDLCYTESRWSTFWSGVWNHLLKPKTI